MYLRSRMRMTRSLPRTAETGQSEQHCMLHDLGSQLQWHHLTDIRTTCGTTGSLDFKGGIASVTSCTTQQDQPGGLPYLMHIIDELRHNSEHRLDSGLLVSI